MKQGGVFFFKEMTRIISEKSGRKRKTTVQASGIFCGITNTTRCFNNFFCWAICPAFFLSWARTIVRFILPAPAGEEDKKNYLFVLTRCLMWDNMGLLKQKRNI